MSIEARAQLFGDPTETLVAEAVWMHFQEERDWPFWDEAIEAIAHLAECGKDEAEVRLLGAIAADEVRPRIPTNTRVMLAVELNDKMADQITRRYIDMTLPRRATGR